MRRAPFRLLLVVLTGLVHANIARAEQASKQDEQWLTMQRNMRAQWKRQFGGMAVRATFKSVGDILHFSLEGGKIGVTAEPVPTSGMTRIKVEDSDAVWMMIRHPAAAGNPQSRPSVNLNRFDFEQTDDQAFWATYLTVADNMVHFMWQSVYNRVSFNQTNGILTLSVVEWKAAGQPPKTLFTAKADTLQALRAEHPREFEQYVRPMLGQYSNLAWLRPGAADVYGVFSELQADPAVARKLMDLLPQLDSASPADREAASAQLEAAGPGVVLAAMRMGERDLSEEQKLRLNHLVAESRHRSAAELATARKDMSFLTDCLEFDDEQVRVAAKGLLEESLGHSIDVDVKGSGPALTEAVNAFRRDLVGATTRPATQPAE